MEFAAGKFLPKEGKVHHSQQWEELQQILNALSIGPDRYIKQWQKVIIYLLFILHEKQRIKKSIKIEEGKKQNRKCSYSDINIRFIPFSCRNIHRLFKDIHKMYISGHFWNMNTNTFLYPCDIHLTYKLE